MCGISCIVGIKGPELGRIEEMNAVIRHRGPDDSGLVFFCGNKLNPVVFGTHDTSKMCYGAPFPFCPTRPFYGSVPEGAFMALGHRRLSIIETSPAGHQPMCTEDERYWIVYNGEIYNYKELRQELSCLGYRFQSHSDTEVILNAYNEWGRESLQRFNGMFAFVLLDRIRKKLFFARDRFGVKPLYYWISRMGFMAFASEIKQFSVLPGWIPQINGQRAYDFLNWGLSDHTEETMFAGVHQFRGGEALEIDLQEVQEDGTLKFWKNGTLPIYRWYNLSPKSFYGTIDKAAYEFHELLEDSVRLRLRSDVPVGSCLSGGVDSSSIVCLIDDLRRRDNATKVHETFSACSEFKRFDEREFIDEVVKSTSISPNYIYPSLDNLFETLEDISWHQDEPFGSTSIYAQWSVFKLAAEKGIKVMLDGQGADEQLAGYHSFFGPYYANLLLTLQWEILLQEIQALKQLHGYSKISAIKCLIKTLLPEPIRQGLLRIVGKTSNTPNWLNMERLGAVPRNPFAVGGLNTRSVRAFSFSQLISTNLPMLLHWEDRNSMAHSIESRVPFLDYRLVEFVQGLPDEYKIQYGLTKRILRESMKGYLPERVRMRMDKMGFVTPEEIWVRETSPQLFRLAIQKAVSGSFGVLNPNTLEKAEDIIIGKKPFNFFVWRVISFGVWVQKFNVKIGSVPFSCCDNLNRDRFFSESVVLAEKD